jgi:hypothetical protein
MGWAGSMVMVLQRLSGLMRGICVFCVLVSLTAAQVVDRIPPLSEATKAVNEVFAKYSARKQVLPLSDHPVFTPVRPLSSSLFKPLEGYFSVRQQENVDKFLHALGSLVNTRNRLAQALRITQEWWWPTGVDRLKVDAVLTQDLLTGRTENPDKMSISTPRPVDGKLEVTVQEAYTEHGQDRVLGRGHRISIVTLIPERDRWVIDEIATTNTDAYGDTRADTLSQRLQDAIKPLHAAERAIEKLPQTLEVKKGVKAEN